MLSTSFNVQKIDTRILGYEKGIQPLAGDARAPVSSVNALSLANPGLKTGHTM
mgnify:CR=1 FL=1